MERNDSGPGALFRLPNTQLVEEIERMDGVLDSVKGAASPAHRHDFRLNADPFFLKLCPRIVFNPDSIGLTPGMYMPLGYWRFIEKDPDLVGKRGGRVVTYENIGRYLDNSDFAAIVRGAWIGTTPQQTALLAPVVEALLNNGRAVAIAVKRDKPAPQTTTADVELEDEELL